METASQIRTVAASLRALLEGLIDYAGLFPPAALGMQQAVANYASYLEGDYRWALGRFIVPASKLGDLRAAMKHLETRETWKVSAIVGADTEVESEAIRVFNATMGSRAIVDVVEVKAGTTEEVGRTFSHLPKTVIPYFEVPGDATIDILRSIGSLGGRAKIRTGGLVESAFPTAEQIAQFITRCAEAKVAFKATAGLHHPLRCVKPLTYAANAPKGTMHGFLNVFLAACAYGGLGEPVRSWVPAILMNVGPQKFVFGDEDVMLRGLAPGSLGEVSIPTDMIRRERQNFAIAFGSCSFEEPIEDLHSFQLL